MTANAQRHATTGYGRTYACVSALVRTTPATSRWRRRERMANDRTEEPFSTTRRVRQIHTVERCSAAAAAYFIDIRVHICASRRKQFIQIILYTFRSHKERSRHKSALCRQSVSLILPRMFDRTVYPHTEDKQGHTSLLINFPQFAANSESTNASVYITYYCAGIRVASF